MPEKIEETAPDSTQQIALVKFDEENRIVVTGLPDIYIELEIPDFNKKKTVGKYYVKKQTAFECEPYMGDSVGKYEWGMEDWGVKITEGNGEFEPDNRFSVEEDFEYEAEDGSDFYGQCILTETEEGFKVYQAKLQYPIPDLDQPDSDTGTTEDDGASGPEEEVGGNEHVFKLYISKQNVLIYRDPDKEKLIIPDGEQPAGTEVQVFSVVFLDNQEDLESVVEEEVNKRANDASGTEENFCNDSGFKIISCVNRIVIAHRGADIDDEEPENYALFMDKLRMNDKGEITESTTET